MLLVLSLPGSAVCVQWDVQYEALIDMQASRMLNWLTAVGGSILICVEGELSLDLVNQCIIRVQGKCFRQ